MKDKVVNIVINYGTKAYKFLWIKQTSGGIYWGFYSKKIKGLHMSHHVDGNCHTKLNGKYIQERKSILLSDIKDIYPLATVCPCGAEAADVLSVLYNQERLQNIVWVDMRCFPKNSTVNIHLYLARPEKLSELSSPWFNKKEGNDYHLIQIINAINPWLVVHVKVVSNENP